MSRPLVIAIGSGLGAWLLLRTGLLGSALAAAAGYLISNELEGAGAAGEDLAQDPGDEYSPWDDVATDDDDIAAEVTDDVDASEQDELDFGTDLLEGDSNYGTDIMGRLYGGMS